jgi:drug/metabolite transporter (DMT)-like permease
MIQVFYYVSIGLLIVAQMFNVYGSFVNSTNKDSTVSQTYWISLPYMIVQRILNMWAISIINIYKYMTNNQVVMLIVILQFLFTVILSYTTLHRPIYISDIVGCIAVVIGYYISIHKLYSGILLHKQSK